MLDSIGSVPHADHRVNRRRLSAGGSALRRLAPGLLLTTMIAGLSFLLRAVLPGAAMLSPLILSIVLGIIMRNTLGTPPAAQPGVTFSLRRILRFAIILLGLQLTLAQIAAVGSIGLLIILATLGATFAFTLWFGRRLRVEPALALLIASGTSICGASAVIATNSVAGGPDEDVAYAVACVTVFGSLSMLLYPVLSVPLHLGAHEYGLWAGSSIHEIAQVIAAAFQNGTEAGDFATIAKLSRVTLLAPLLLLLGYVAHRRARRQQAQETDRKAPPLPWFVLGFVAMILVNSLALVPAATKPPLVQITSFLLSMALAAMGLETDLRKLRAKGWKPLLLGAAAWLFIASFSLALIETAGI